MSRYTLPRALFVALVAAAAVQPAAALPPLRADLVDELTLSQISGKYLGADMLVGLRIDLVSTLHTPQQGSATASGALSIRRVDGGFEVQVDSRSTTVADVANATVAPGNASASGAETLQVNGIAQVSQIAGDGNRLANVTTILFLPDNAAAAPADFNGQTTSSSSAGGLTAQVSFLGGGIGLGVNAPGAALAQHLRTGGSGGQVLQFGQLAGNGLVGANQLQLQLMTSQMPTQALHQLGIQQALAGLSAFGR